MIPAIITKKISLRQIKKDNEGAEATAHFDPETERHIVTIPYKVSTKTRLHEIAHCELGHCQSLLSKPKLLISEYIAQEIAADEWACQKCGKLLSLEAVLNIIHQAIEWGARANFVFNNSTKALVKHNYKLTREQRSELWRNCLEFERERKQEGERE